MDDHQFSPEFFDGTGELAPICTQIVLSCVDLARIGRHDRLWTVNFLARSVTKWNRDGDKRLARLTCYLRHSGAESEIVPLDAGLRMKGRVASCLRWCCCGCCCCPRPKVYGICALEPGICSPCARASLCSGTAGVARPTSSSSCRNGGSYVGASRAVLWRKIRKRSGKCHWGTVWV